MKCMGFFLFCFVGIFPLRNVEIQTDLTQALIQVFRPASAENKKHGAHSITHSLTRLWHIRRKVPSLPGLPIPCSWTAILQGASVPTPVVIRGCKRLAGGGGRGDGDDQHSNTAARDKRHVIRNLDSFQTQHERYDITFSWKLTC